MHLGITDIKPSAEEYFAEETKVEKIEEDDMYALMNKSMQSFTSTSYKDIAQ